MMDMPPLRFAHVNGVRMGFYEAGPASDPTPFVLCHGWPEIAFTWRRQIKALSEAGYRVVAPDQRGYGATDCPSETEDYSIEHLTGDLVGLLDHLGLDKAIFVGHDWGGFVVWEMALKHAQRVAGVVSLNTPHLKRAPADPIAILRGRHGERMYIVAFQNPDHEADRFFAENVDKLFDAFLRAPLPRKASEVAGAGVSSKVNLDFAGFLAAYDSQRDKRARIMPEEERKVFVDAFRRTGFTGGINWYRNITRNWERAAGRDDTIRAPALMIMAERDLVQRPASADRMETLVPNLTKHLVRDCGQWTQEEKPQEVSATIIDWRRRVLERSIGADESVRK
jgi:pimeloyl-ACP methyl ester carboxylesterase